MPRTSQNAVTFAQRLSQDTGLSKAVILGWVNAETSGWDTTNGPNNWLNVGSFDSGFAGGGANVWADPISAADATASFMLGRPVHGKTSPVGPGSSSIQAIPQTRNQGIAAQIAAIQDSDWASSHYGYNLASSVQPFVKGKIQIITGPGPNGGIVRPGGDSGGGGTSFSGPTGDTQFTALEDSPRTAPTQYVDLSGDITAPFKWWWGQFSSSWDQTKKSFDQMISPVGSLVSAGKTVDAAATEVVNILEHFDSYVLRFTEFTTGMLFMLIGFYLAMQPGGSRGSSFVSRAVELSPIGKARALATGRREGRTEHYRLQGRRDERARLAARTQAAGQKKRESRTSQ